MDDAGGLTTFKTLVPWVFQRDADLSEGKKKKNQAQPRKVL